MLQKIKLWAKGRMSFLTRRILGPHVKALVVQAGDYRFLIDPEDYGVGHQLRKHGHYGLDELERLRPLVSENSRVLVVGTHVGTLAIPLSAICKSVDAIEANPVTFKLLQANVAINQVQNLFVHNIAASDSNQPLKFLVNRSNSGGSKIVPKNKDFMYYYDKPQEISVEGIPLDEKFAEQEFDLIVMDIEGSEYFALRGMQQILSRASTLVVEFVPHHLRNVSGVTVEEFLDTLTAYDTLTIPTLGKTVGKADFAKVLGQLYRQGKSDDGIIFQQSAGSV
ncbi:Met-10+ like-protein [Rubripirellula lacrimiformis]|uniref:Met-10+ like-protein n=1 Tax=Rubripirellula lacrimiformis TaxID=1930273 RepID=A0A517N5H4_9BACT|nr:FkbM family methyltransferase [Rubripirellula lacrimiformis]QDT02389.1 Met-10+ like-protein [Rubripirellula lacrimiformis]